MFRAWKGTRAEMKALRNPKFSLRSLGHHQHHYHQHQHHYHHYYHNQHHYHHHQHHYQCQSISIKEKIDSTSSQLHKHKSRRLQARWEMLCRSSKGESTGLELKHCWWFLIIVNDVGWWSLNWSFQENRNGKFLVMGKRPKDANSPMQVPCERQGLWFSSSGSSLSTTSQLSPSRWKYQHWIENF